ncbi:hypothetical protein GCM10011609_04660 [Lentzea pudingi]|uniref:Uncharacterized protein n=1 Tax=Lentzea pudingi TaxID=1789439 RepID=A0ABQ2HBC3_9PSEU|nr:hypothetical protein GCM10011609_04660 [Lentzea pudingi]
MVLTGKPLRRAMPLRVWRRCLLSKVPSSDSSLEETVAATPGFCPVRSSSTGKTHAGPPAGCTAPPRATESVELIDEVLGIPVRPAASWTAEGKVASGARELLITLGA